MSLDKSKCLVKNSSELNMISENDCLTNHKTFFDDFHTDNLASSRNDDEGEPSRSKTVPLPNSNNTAEEQSFDNREETVQIGEEDFSEGNDFEINDVPFF